MHYLQQICAWQFPSMCPTEHKLFRSDACNSLSRGAMPIGVRRRAVQVSIFYLFTSNINYNIKTDVYFESLHTQKTIFKTFPLHLTWVWVQPYYIIYPCISGLLATTLLKCMTCKHEYKLGPQQLFMHGSCNIDYGIFKSLRACSAYRKTHLKVFLCDSYVFTMDEIVDLGAIIRNYSW